MFNFNEASEIVLKRKSSENRQHNAVHLRSLLISEYEVRISKRIGSDKDRAGATGFRKLWFDFKFKLNCYKRKRQRKYFLLQLYPQFYDFSIHVVIVARFTEKSRQQTLRLNLSVAKAKRGSDKLS